MSSTFWQSDRRLTHSPMLSWYDVFFILHTSSFGFYQSFLLISILYLWHSHDCDSSLLLSSTFYNIISIYNIINNIVIPQRKIPVCNWYKSSHDIHKYTLFSNQSAIIAVTIDWLCLINIQDVYNHASDRRLAGCILALPYVVVSFMHILWLNSMSYVSSRRPCCLFILFEGTIKYTNFALRYNKAAKVED